jgi:hypothetical protein
LIRGPGSLIVWLVAYAVLVAAIALLLVHVRRRAIESLSGPEARAEWQRWKEDEERRHADELGPVRRRPPTSVEPPALVLLRDSFPGILAVSLLVVTFLFGFAMLVMRGMLADAGGRSVARKHEGKDAPAKP